MAQIDEDKKLERYQKTIPPNYQLGVNTFVTALVQGLAKGDADIEVEFVEAGKQIFTETAEKVFLDNLGSGVGVIRPAQVNLSDDKFRRLIPTMSFKPKQVRATMYDVLDVFYGPLFSRANLISFANQPFNMGAVQALTGTVTFQTGSPIVSGVGSLFLSELQIGTFIRFSAHGNEFFGKVASITSNTQLRLSLDYTGGSGNALFAGVGIFYNANTLKVIVDERTEQTLELSPIFMANTQIVDAAEIVQAINNATNVQTTAGTITASVIEDPINDKFFIDIRTDTPGSTGSLQITGGTANQFAFINQNNNVQQIFIDNDLASQFSVTDSVRVGSKSLPETVTTISAIDTDTPVVGTTRITVAVDVGQYTESDKGYIYINGDLGLSTDKNLVTQLDLQTVIYEVNSKELVVRMPATVPSLRRALTGASHPRGSWYGDILSVDNSAKTVTANMFDFVNTNTLAGEKLATGFEEFEIVSHTLGTEGVVLTLDPLSDLSKIFDTATSLTGTVTIGSGTDAVSGAGTAFTTELSEGDIIIIGNEVHSVKTITDNTNLILARNHVDGATGVNFTTMPEGLDKFTIISDTFVSAYVYDPENTSFTATSVRCRLDQVISKGTINPTITVEDASDIPDTLGKLIFDFGRSNQEVPVIYRGRPNNNTLLLDPSYVFENTHLAGEIINLITSPVLPTTPAKDGTDYATFITGLKEARIAVQNLIRQIKAAGVSVRFIVDTPSYLWTTSFDPSELF